MTLVTIGRCEAFMMAATRSERVLVMEVDFCSVAIESIPFALVVEEMDLDRFLTCIDLEKMKK